MQINEKLKEDLEKELKDELGNGLNSMLSQKDTIQEDILVEYLENTAMDVICQFLEDNPEIIILEIVNDKELKDSQIQAGDILQQIKYAEILSSSIQNGINVKSIYNAAHIYYDAEADAYSVRNQAIAEMTKEFLFITEDAVSKLPVIGPYQSVVIKSLNECFENGFNLTTKRLAQIQYTEIMCEYYSGNLDANELVYEMSQIYNLSDEYKAKVIALVTMETKFDGIDVEQEETFQYQKDSWIAKGQEIYGRGFGSTS